MVAPKTFIAKGPKPVLIDFTTKENELEWLISQVKTSVSTSSNIVICRNRAKLEHIEFDRF